MQVKFEVGDRVLVVGQESHFPTLGMSGVVWSVRSNGVVGVKHDSEFEGGHELQNYYHDPEHASPTLCHEDRNKGLWYYDPSNQLMKYHWDYADVSDEAIEEVI